MERRDILVSVLPMRCCGRLWNMVSEARFRRGRALMHPQVDCMAFRTIIWTLLLITLVTAAVAVGQPILLTDSVDVMILLIIFIAFNAISAGMLGVGKRTVVVSTVLTCTQCANCALAVAVPVIMPLSVAADHVTVWTTGIALFSGVIFTIVLVMGADVMYCSNRGSNDTGGAYGYLDEGGGDGIPLMAEERGMRMQSLRDPFRGGSALDALAPATSAAATAHAPLSTSARFMHIPGIDIYSDRG